MVADNLMRRYALPTRVIYPALSDDKFKVLDELPLPSNPSEDSAREQDLIKKGFSNKEPEIMPSIKKPTLSQAMIATKNEELRELKNLQFYSNSDLSTLTRERENIKAKTYAQEDLNSIRSSVYNLALNLGAEPRIADNFSTAADWTPIIGDFAGFEDAVDNYKAGNYGTAIFDATLATIGLAPIAGDIIKNILKGTRKIKSKDPYFDSTEELDDSALNSPLISKMIISTNTDDLDAIRDLTNNEFKSMPYVPGATRTGWTNLNGRAVYEISDSAAGMNTSLLKTDVGKTIDFKDYDTYHAIFENGDVPKSLIEMYSIKTIKLGELLKHDELFKAYPELKNVTVRLNVDEGRGIMGSAGFNLAETTGDSFTSGSTINIAPVWKYIDQKTLKLNEDLYQKTLLHEIQHVIQRMESLPRGSSTEISGLKLMDWFDALPPGKTKNIISKDLAKSFGVSAIGSNNLPESVKMYTYRMAGGEVTSRVTEASKDFTVEELINKPLLKRIQTAKEKALNDPRILEPDKSGPIQTKEFDKIVGKEGLEAITAPEEIVFDNFNFPSSSMEDIKTFIKTKFKKIRELKFISKLKKGTPITFGGKKYIFKEFKMGTWNPSGQFNSGPEFIVNPSIRHGDRSLIDENFTGPMVIMRNENGDLTKIPVLSLVNDLSKKSALKLRVELNKFYKPGLMSKIYTQLGGPN